MNEAKKEIRGRVQVEVDVKVRHVTGSVLDSTEIARTGLQVEAVLDRGDGSLLDNEHVVSGLVDKALFEAQGKVQVTLDDQFTERRIEVDDERWALQLHDAELYIAKGETPADRDARAKLLGEFLGHDFGEAPA